MSSRRGRRWTFWLLVVAVLPFGMRTPVISAAGDNSTLTAPRHAGSLPMVVELFLDEADRS